MSDSNNEIGVTPEMEDEEKVELKRQKRHHRKTEESDMFFLIRQVLNILFMIGAVIGCFIYLKVNDTMGTIVIVIAMAFKMAEYVLRFKK